MTGKNELFQFVFCLYRYLSPKNGRFLYLQILYFKLLYMGKMSDESGAKIDPQGVPGVSVKDQDTNNNIMIARTEMKSGIITEGDHKDRKESGRSRLSSGE